MTIFETPRSILLVIGFVIFAAILGTLYFLGFIFPPSPFEGTTIITVPEGATAKEVGEILGEKKLIRSELLFQFLSKILEKDRTIRRGTYVFTEPDSIPGILEHLTISTPDRKITILEGWGVEQIGDYLEARQILSQEEFILSAQKYEGELFPDTYAVSDNVSADELVLIMTENFKKRVENLDERKKFSGNFLEALIIASLIEREAAGAHDRYIISGILWKRLMNERPLQVDASITYLTGKASEEITSEDLSMDSPFNTYTNLGLPPHPLGNPGLSALRAAFQPEETPYWFYLHDANGTAHYAVTFEEHVENKAKYLK